jgi:hypothetical protein
VSRAGERGTLVRERLWNANQSWHYERIVRFLDYTLRVRIRRNSADFQSSAAVERWSGDNGWQQVAASHIAECACQSASYVTSSTPQRPFDADADRLITLAKEILR